MGFVFWLNSCIMTHNKKTRTIRNYHSVKFEDRPLEKVREETIDQLVMNYGHGELSSEAFERCPMRRWTQPSIVNLLR